MPAARGVLLDSSAILAHAFGESGADDVDELLGGSVSVAAVTWLEVYVQLARSKNADPIFARYRALSETLAITEEIVDEAIRLRRSTPLRLPSLDSLIAATARVHGLRLIHRDAHLAHIPEDLLLQTLLPAKL
jgi:predicted nucleic acid-binding protein